MIYLYFNIVKSTADKLGMDLNTVVKVVSTYLSLQIDILATAEVPQVEKNKKSE